MKGFPRHYGAADLFVKFGEVVFASKTWLHHEVQDNLCEPPHPPTPTLHSPVISDVAAKIKNIGQ